MRRQCPCWAGRGNRVGGHRLCPSHGPEHSPSYVGSLSFISGFFALPQRGQKFPFIEADSQPGFFSGITLQAINPKAYAVNTALFSGFAILPDALLMETVIKFGILNAIWIPIHLLWLAAGIYVERMDLAPHIQFRVNLLMACSLMVVVILAIYSLL